MKRITILFVILVLGLLIISGCQYFKKDDSQPAKSEPDKPGIGVSSEPQKSAAVQNVEIKPPKKEAVDSKVPLEVELVKAIEDGNQQAVNECIKRGADLNARIWTKGTKGKGEWVPDEDSIKPGNQFRCETPIIVAVKNNQMEIIKLLISKGVDLEIMGDIGTMGSGDGYSYNSLHYACEKGNLEIASFLIDHGANVNAYERFFEDTACISTPLMLAVQSGNIKLVDLLIKKGADINTLDYDGNISEVYGPDCKASTASDYADDNIEIKELLKKHGAVSGKK